MNLAISRITQGVRERTKLGLGNILPITKGEESRNKMIANINNMLNIK